jgi:hypothetical protein
MRKSIYEITIWVTLNVIWFGLISPGVANLDNTGLMLATFIISIVLLVEGIRRVYKCIINMEKEIEKNQHSNEPDSSDDN